MVAPEPSRILTNPKKLPDIPNTDFWSYLKEHFLSYGDRDALVDHHTGAKFTFTEVVEIVENLAAHFQEIGLEPGVYVSFQTHNCVESLLVAMAIMATGAVIVPITLAYSGTSTELIQIVELANCTFSYCTYKYINNARGLLSAAGNRLKKCFIFGGKEKGFTTIDNFFNTKPSQPFKSPKLNAKEDDCCIILTSGTTGLPKAIQHTHYNGVVATEILKFSDNRLFYGGDNYLAWHPMVHFSGLFMTMIALGIGSRCIIATSGEDGDNFGEIIEKYQIQVLMALPNGLWNMLQTMKKQNRKYNLSSVARMMVAGSCISKALMQEIKSAFPNLKQARSGYGMSESMGLVTMTPADKAFFDSAGKPVAGVQVKIIDPKTGEALGPNEEGEIYIKTPAVMKGYLGREKDTAETIVNGWLRSGDLGYYDNEGNLHCVDRLKHMIKCLDCQTSSIELEDELQKHPAVEEVAVVGIPDEDVGEAPTACVVLRSSYKASEKLANELVQLINGKFARNKHLFGGVHFFSKLPMTDTGKISKKELKQILQGRRKAH